MKPISTWVLIANARKAYVLDYQGPSKGLKPLADLVFESAAPAEFSDGPTVGHHRHGHGRHEIAQSDPARSAEQAFAAQLAGALKTKAQAGAFERLLVAAAPHMLGSLRAAMSKDVSARIIGELPKDLTQVALQDMPAHLEDHLLV